MPDLVHVLSRRLVWLVCAAVLGATPAVAFEGVSKGSITVGQSVALTGPLAALGLPFQQGAKLYFDRVNSAGGVNGREINLTTLDDTGSAAKAATNTQQLLDSGVLALFGYVGSSQVLASYAAVKKTDVLLFGSMAAADELRGSLYPQVYSMRAGYAEEASAMSRHASQLGVRRVALVSAKDDESLAALDSAIRTVQAISGEAIRGTIDALDPVLAKKPEAVWVISDFRSAAGVVTNLRSKGFKGPIYGFSNTGESLLAEQLGAAGAGVVVARVTPKPDGQKIVLARDFQADVVTAKLGKPNVYMFEGYIAARAFVEAIKRVGKDPTRAKLKKAIDGMQNVDLGGFRVHFEGERSGSKLVELSLIDSAGRVRE